MGLIDRLVGKIIRRLVTWHYKRTGFLVYSWGIDEHTDITIRSEEYYSDGYRIGTKDFKHETG